MKYLCHFISVSATVHHSRSHMNPMKVGAVENGTSLEDSHGMPRLLEMLTISVRLQANRWSALSLFWWQNPIM